MSNQQWTPQQPPYGQQPPPQYGQPQQPMQPPPMYQPPPPQPRPKRGRVFLIVGIILAVILVACIGISTLLAKSSNTGTVIQNSQNASQNNTPASTPAQSQHFKVGQVVKVGDTWNVTVNSATTSQGTQYVKPTTGNVYLVIDVTLKNISSQEQDLSSLLQFALKDSTGQKYNETYFDSSKTSPNGKVEAGSLLRGQLSYEVPLSQHTFTLAFQASLTEPGQTIWDITV